MKKLLRNIWCFLGNHDWTCKAYQGILPDAVKLQADPLGYFHEYAKMYCKHCGTVSRLST